MKHFTFTRHSVAAFVKLIAAFLLAAVVALPSFAQRSDTAFRPVFEGDSTQGTPLQSVKHYTVEHPLVYEGAQDLWPYSFLNDHGEPDGYNIELISLMLQRLNIPFTIHMKPRLQAFKDLKEGRSDLMIGLTAGFHEEYSQYSMNAVTLFTQSVLSPKRAPTEIRNFRDLASHRVYVNDSSLCHHLMIDYGWGDNAIPTHTIGETIRKMSNEESGEMIWNTVSLKWMLRKFQIDNLEITPINMPHGEYRFMSHDTALLHLLDSMFVVLNSNEELLALQDKWFYPERETEPTAPWLRWAVGGGLVVLFLALVYYVIFRIQLSRVKHKTHDHNLRLAQVLGTSHVHIWTYDIRQRLFSWRNEQGETSHTYTPEEFATRYSAADFARLQSGLDELSATAPGTADQEIQLELQARDVESDGEERTYIVVLSILERDRQGRPSVLIGTKKDVTRLRQRQRKAAERRLHYEALFHTPAVGILRFDASGRLADLNATACQLLGRHHDDIVSSGITVSELFSDHHPHLDHRLISITGPDGTSLGSYAVCLDMSQQARSRMEYDAARANLTATESQLSAIQQAVGDVLSRPDVRLTVYSPRTHTLTIHRADGSIQHALTQTRCMTLVDGSSSLQAMRMLNAMDDQVRHPINALILTTLRIRGGLRLSLRFSLMPVLSAKGDSVEQYWGLLADQSELHDIRQRIGQQTAKIHEVAATQTRFINNMVQEIRTPMDAVISCVEQLHDDIAVPNENELLDTIITNSNHLLHLIDNILYLSRLQAHMVEINMEPRNFADTFESHCTAGWEPYRNSHTNYVVENPYEKLVVGVDTDNLGRAIQQIAANAAQHTNKGIVRARYEYIGHRLIISIDDTGEGMPPDVLRHINESTSSTLRDAHGLGLSITRELVSQMGGTIDITSELGVGTTVYITLPCSAYEMNRKKNYLS